MTIVDSFGNQFYKKYIISQAAASPVEKRKIRKQRRLCSSFLLISGFLFLFSGALKILRKANIDGSTFTQLGRGHTGMFNIGNIT